MLVRLEIEAGKGPGRAYWRAMKALGDTAPFVEACQRMGLAL